MFLAYPKAFAHYLSLKKVFKIMVEVFFFEVFFIFIFFYKLMVRRM